MKGLLCSSHLHASNLIIRISMQHLCAVCSWSGILIGPPPHTSHTVAWPHFSQIKDNQLFFLGFGMKWGSRDWGPQSSLILPLTPPPLYLPYASVVFRAVVSDPWRGGMCLFGSHSGDCCVFSFKNGGGVRVYFIPGMTLIWTYPQFGPCAVIKGVETLNAVPLLPCIPTWVQTWNLISMQSMVKHANVSPPLCKGGCGLRMFFESLHFAPAFSPRPEPSPDTKIGLPRQFWGFTEHWLSRYFVFFSWSITVW